MPAAKTDKIMLRTIAGITARRKLAVEYFMSDLSCLQSTNRWVGADLDVIDLIGNGSGFNSSLPVSARTSMLSGIPPNRQTALS